jgi:hypothetical protein
LNTKAGREEPISAGPAVGSMREQDGLRMTWRREKKPVHLIWHKIYGELVSAAVYFYSRYRYCSPQKVLRKCGNWAAETWESENGLNMSKQACLYVIEWNIFWHLSPAIYCGYTYQNCRRQKDF